MFRVDVENKIVIVKNNGEFYYDYVVVVLGFVFEIFGIKGVMENVL